jgi:FtsP/CotA-like multicopper oxidase with cupredoxin domain
LSLSRSITRLAISSLAALVALSGCTTSGGHHDTSSHAVSVAADDFQAVATGTTRTYYIAAEEVTWDYAPQGKNVITGKRFTPEESVFTEASPTRSGSKYVKCLYVGYTDATFKTKLPQPADMGLLGPTLRAEVGDRVVVHYRNNCSFGNSIHVHGFQYKKDSEGAPYQDGKTIKDDDEIAPGGYYTYHYTVPQSAGPTDSEGSTAMWMYHSHSDEIKDVYAGLTGFIVVTRHGEAKADGSPKDVDQEIFQLYEVDNENLSTLAEVNFAKLQKDRDPEEFEESNLMHSINGFVYGNGPMPVLKAGSRVRWYLMGMGTEVDLHTPHWHGNTVVSMGMRTDVVTLLPATMVTADMTPNNVGIWKEHCHVADHIAAGMIARYQVID